eukprot:GHVP01004315.1.p2 GENE.GHVP01004315.1~~GHVP01004315.1.p2  ORF type:complete len:103 (+),score=2.60 GHVP01004315.1:578-886(+)
MAHRITFSCYEQVFSVKSLVFFAAFPPHKRITVLKWKETALTDEDCLLRVVYRSSSFEAEDSRIYEASIEFAHTASALRVEEAMVDSPIAKARGFEVLQKDG